jgi:hypothetical protein
MTGGSDREGRDPGPSGVPYLDGDWVRSPPAGMRITYGLARDSAPVTSSGILLNPLCLSVLLSEFDNDYPQYRP